MYIMACNSKCIICQPWLLITIKILTLKSCELCVISYLSFHLQLSCKHLYSSTWENKIFCFVLIQWFWINRKWSYDEFKKEVWKWPLKRTLKTLRPDRKKNRYCRGVGDITKENHYFNQLTHSFIHYFLNGF